MINWQHLEQFVKSAIYVLKRRRREQAAFAIAAFCFSGAFVLGGGKLVPDFKDSSKWIVGLQAALYAIGAIAFVYAALRVWRLVNPIPPPPAKDRPSAIKGPTAFSEADGELFRRLGRESELQNLLGLILDDQALMVVVRGASGAGKTSLLRAGLKHILGDRVIFHYWEAVPSEPDKGLLRAIHERWPEGVAKPASLDELINPIDSLGRRSHVIVLDQFEQLRGSKKIFQLLRRTVRESKPPHRITWVIAFRREFSADWMDFISPEQERGVRAPQDVSLRLFTADQAREVTGQLVNESNLKDSIEQSVINNLVEAATVEGEVSPVDIGIGLLVLAELHERQSGKTVTIRDYQFAGGDEGLLTQYISRCLELFPKESQEGLLKAMLALRDPEENRQRLATGLTNGELAAEAGADARVLKSQLNRLADRDIRLLETDTPTDGSEMRYRLPHERLVPALYRLTGKLLAEVDQAKLRFQNAFQAWKMNDKRSRYLLKSKDLRLVERYETQIPWGPDEEEKKIFLFGSKRQRRFVRATTVAAGLAVITVGWVFWLQYQRRENESYLRDESGYPEQIYDYQHQLKKLELTEPFNLDRFVWLSSDSVEELSLTAASSSNSIAGLTSLSRSGSLKKLTLDLSDSQVRDLKPLEQLGQLTQLTLKLSGNTDLRPLEHLQRLTELTLRLSGNSDLTSLAQLKELTQLTLDFSDGNQLSDLTSLAQLKELTKLTLDLSGQDQLGDLTPLVQLKGLTQLTLNLGSSRVTYSGVSHLTPLEQLKELTQLTLDLRGSRVQDLKPLEQLQRLTHLTLDLSHSQVRDLKPLEQLKQLTQLTLDLSDRQERDLKPLEQLKGLTQLTLDLSNSQERDLKPLEQLQRLTQLTLRLDNSQVQDLKSLEQLKGLSQLTLSLVVSQVRDLKPLEQLTGLKQLTLSPNGINDLKSLEQLKGLTELTLRLSGQANSLQLLDLKPLEQLKGLTHNLSRDSDLAPLEQLKGLTQLTLYLIGHQAHDLRPLEQLQHLTQLTLDLSHAQVRDLKSLEQLKGLTELTLHLSDSQVIDLAPLEQLKGLTQLTLYLGRSEGNNLERLKKLSSLQKLSIGSATTKQRISLQNIPAHLVELKF